MLCTAVAPVLSIVYTGLHHMQKCLKEANTCNAEVFLETIFCNWTAFGGALARIGFLKQQKMWNPNVKFDCGPVPARCIDRCQPRPVPFDQTEDGGRIKSSVQLVVSPKMILAPLPWNLRVTTIPTCRSLSPVAWECKWAFGKNTNSCKTENNWSPILCTCCISSPKTHIEIILNSVVGKLCTPSPWFSKPNLHRLECPGNETWNLKRNTLKQNTDQEFGEPHFLIQILIC